MASVQMAGYQVLEPKQLGIVTSDYIIIIFFQSYVLVLKSNCVIFSSTCSFRSILIHPRFKSFFLLTLHQSRENIVIVQT